MSVTPVSQNEFNQLVERYNEDFNFWRACVEAGDLQRSSRVLSTLHDTYELIIEVKRITNFSLTQEVSEPVLENLFVEKGVLSASARK